jgi:aryl-alcohol dehydrogenase-like predicted oxidoreductase
MEYRPLGRTGVMVSSLCLGAMNFGGVTPAEEGIAIIERALAAGINFIDTANVYNAGASERVVGQALHQNGKRDEVVLATKAAHRATTSSKPARIRCAACKPITLTCINCIARRRSSRRMKRCALSTIWFTPGRCCISAHRRTRPGK